MTAGPAAAWPLAGVFAGGAVGNAGAGAGEAVVGDACPRVVPPVAMSEAASGAVPAPATSGSFAICAAAASRSPARVRTALGWAAITTAGPTTTSGATVGRAGAPRPSGNSRPLVTSNIPVRRRSPAPSQDTLIAAGRPGADGTTGCSNAAHRPMTPPRVTAGSPV